MDTSAMKFQFGRCKGCGQKFNDELRNKYNITHCPWCGEIILDYLNDTNIPKGFPVKVDTNRFIYCEECGTRIYERDGKGGRWIEHGESVPGICSGPCERELCGRCADWDINGECEQCRNSVCGQCPNHDAVLVCYKCEHLQERLKWADQRQKNPCTDCPMENDCLNENTDKRHECMAFNQYQKSLVQEGVKK